MKRQQALLILLAILVAAGLYAILASPTQERIAGSFRSTNSDDRKTAAREKIKESLRLELLDRGDVSFESVSRDIFNFYTPPPPPPPPPPVVKRPLPPPPPPVIKKLPVQAPPPPPLARFTFLGLLDIDEEISVFLASGDQLFIVKDGAVFGEKKEFQVEQITGDEIHIRQKNPDGVIKVALQEKEQKPGGVHPEATPTQRVAPQQLRRAPPIARPQLKSFKKYEP